MCKRAGYEKSERVWRHGDCLFYPCYVHCRRPRISCSKHKTKVVEAPWARKNSRFTLLFEGYAMLILADMPIAKASRVIDVEDGRSEQQVIDFSYKLEEKGGECEKIEFASSDLSSAYR